MKEYWQALIDLLAVMVLAGVILGWVFFLAELLS